MPDHYAKHARLMKPTRVRSLWLVSYLPPQPRDDCFNPASAGSWLDRFDEDADWPSPDESRTHRRMPPSDVEVLNAFALAIPGFTAPALTPGQEPMPRDDPDRTVAWLSRSLTREFCCRGEWKEFSAWGVDGIQNLRPLRDADITLSFARIDAAAAGGEVDDLDMAALFIAPLNRQLLPHGLQHIELGHTDDPFLVCMSASPAALQAHRTDLRVMGVEIPDVQG